MLQNVSTVGLWGFSHLRIEPTCPVAPSRVERVRVLATGGRWGGRARKTPSSQQTSPRAPEGSLHPQRSTAAQILKHPNFRDLLWPDTLVRTCSPRLPNPPHLKPPGNLQGWRRGQSGSVCPHTADERRFCTPWTNTYGGLPLCQAGWDCRGERGDGHE